MSFPESVDTVTLTCGPVLDADGNPRAGVKLYAIPARHVFIAETNLRPGILSAATGADGTASLEVIATDSAGLADINGTTVSSFRYRIGLDDISTASSEREVYLPKAHPTTAYEDLVANTAAITPSVLSSTFARRAVKTAMPPRVAMPELLDNTDLANVQSYAGNVATGPDGAIYVAYWSYRGKATVARYLNGTWTTCDLSATVIGALTTDLHNTLVVGVDADSQVFVAGNTHDQTLRMVTSTDFANWATVTISGATVVTYPTFVQFSDYELHFYWRQGQSGDGDLYRSEWDGTSAWSAGVEVINGSDANINPYAQRIAIGSDDRIHLFWCWRADGASANSNYDICYAYSTDRGTTWRKISGELYAAPITPATGDIAFDTAASGSGLVNQNGADVDIYGRPHTVFFQLDAAGHTQIVHLWWDGAEWQHETVSDLATTLTLGSGIVDFTISRPQIVCTPGGGTYVLYRANESGGVLRVINVTTPGEPDEYTLADVDLGNWEPTIDVSAKARSLGKLRMLLTQGKPPTAATNKPLWTRRPGWVLNMNLDDLGAAGTVPANTLRDVRMIHEVSAKDPAGTGTLPADNDPLTLWADLSGAGGHLTCTGGPVWRSNSGNPYVTFDGSNDVAEASPGCKLPTTGTMFCLVRLTASNANPFYGLDDGNNRYMRMERNASGNSQVIRFDSTNAAPVTATGPAMSLNTWYLVRARYGTTSIQVYVDGVGGDPAAFTDASVEEANLIGVRLGKPKQTYVPCDVAYAAWYDYEMTDVEAAAVEAKITAEFPGL